MGVDPLPSSITQRGRSISRAHWETVGAHVLAVTGYSIDAFLQMSTDNLRAAKSLVA